MREGGRPVFWAPTHGPRGSTPLHTPPPQATVFVPALTPTWERAGRTSETSLFGNSLHLHTGDVASAQRGPATCLGSPS